MNLSIPLVAPVRKTTGSLCLDELLGRNRYNVDPLTLPVEAAGMLEWDTMPPEERGRVLGGMLRHLVALAQTAPLYKEDPRWTNISPSDISDISDLVHLPIISKDSIPGTGTPTRAGIRGFRSRVVTDFSALVPSYFECLLRRQEQANPRFADIRDWYGKDWFAFGSGGSLGVSTKTLLSYLTVEMEAQALVRCLRMNGFQPGMSIASFYSPEHKGGLQLARAASIMKMGFHSKDVILAALEARYNGTVSGFRAALQQGDYETAERHAPTVRAGIRDYIETHGIEVIESVQPPSDFARKNAKGSALAFMTLYEEDPTAFASVKHIFLTGFPVPRDAYERLRQDGKTVSTTWGSTEVMALATYPLGSSSPDVNDLVATPFPSVGIVGRYVERDTLYPHLEEVSVGKQGLLLVTRLLAVGSVYVNYAIGDLTTRTESGFRNIQRAATPTIKGSCADDALSL